MYVKKECRRCGRVAGHGSSTMCKRCRLRSLKVEAVALLGGSCSRCGYSKCNQALSFHHIHPTSKSFRPTDMFNMASLTRVLDELSKCVLLCMNCHMEEHASDAY